MRMHVSSLVYVFSCTLQCASLFSHVINRTDNFLIIIILRPFPVHSHLIFVFFFCYFAFTTLHLLHVRCLISNVYCWIVVAPQHHIPSHTIKNKSLSYYSSMNTYMQVFVSKLMHAHTFFFNGV